LPRAFQLFFSGCKRSVCALCGRRVFGVFRVRRERGVAVNCVGLQFAFASWILEKFYLF